MSRSDLVVRTLFLSDIHLGTKGCQPELLLDFLKHCEADTIYLVGDIVDGWRLKSGWYWPQLHNDVVQKLLRKVRKGVRIVYVPGNHDEFLRDFAGSTSAASRSSRRRSTRPPTAGGSSCSTATSSTWSSAMCAGWPIWATGAYEAAIWLSSTINRVRRRWACPTGRSRPGASRR